MKSKISNNTLLSLKALMDKLIENNDNNWGRDNTVTALNMMSRLTEITREYDFEKTVKIQKVIKEVMGEI